MKLNLIILFLLVSSICLSLARRHHSNEYFRHHKTMSKKAISRALEMMQIMSRNLKIRADMKNMGLLGMTLPDDPFDA